MNEGWYFIRVRGGASKTYHYITNFMEDTVRSRCGIFVPTPEEKELLVEIEYEKAPRFKLCGNCERLQKYDSDPKIIAYRQEPHRY